MFEQNPLTGPGSESLTTHTLEIIILLVVAFILGYLLRYFLRKNQENLIDQLTQENQDLQNKLSECRASQAKCSTELQTMAENYNSREEELKKTLSERDERIHQLEEELAALRKENDDLKSTSNEPQTQFATSNIQPEEPAKSFPPVKQDDLKVIEGIGPVINSMLHKAGINTWSDLANANVDFLKEILHQGGDHLLAHDPTTWPEQAALAQAGRWEELKILQDELMGGRRVD